MTLNENPIFPDFVTEDFSLVIGSDHGGYDLKNSLLEYLRSKGYAIEDMGPHSFNAEDDYPDFAQAVAERVAKKSNCAGILICKSGIGMSIQANRVKKVRAALVKTPRDAALSRKHNCANLLVLGGNDLTEHDLIDITDTWLATPFTAEERHIRRLMKIEDKTYNDTLSNMKRTDPDIAALIQKEIKRQHNIIELIASENMVSESILEAAGSVLTNKYAEGYPGKRYYGGCQHVDGIEQLAIDRACELFGAEAANVQPHSGSQANMAAYFALVQPGDTILAMSLDHGGHLTHGMAINFSGRLYNFVSYGVSRETEMIDYDNIEALALEHRPKLIVAGASSYSRIIDFKRLREITDKIDAKLMVDMAHIAGLVATGLHPSPVPYSDIVTTTTHKTLRGPRGGLILCKKKYLKKVNSQIFPGIQGGPLMHIIAGKAVALKEAMDDSFKVYGKSVIANAKALAGELQRLGVKIVSDGTDNHVFSIDLRPLGLTGNNAEKALERAGITVNKNLIPYDPEKPMVTSGLRLGTPTITTRGMTEEDMIKIAGWIKTVLDNISTPDIINSVNHQVMDFTNTLLR